MKAYKIYKSSSNIIYIEGAMVFENIHEIYKRSKLLFKQVQAIEINLSKVNLVDSSALAMLTTWIRAAKKKQQPILFHNLPVELAQLGELCGMNDILPKYIEN